MCILFRSLLTVTCIVMLFGVARSQGELFGDGHHGDFTVGVGTREIWGDSYFQNLTIEYGGTLETHGYTIRVAGTLINNGTITDSYTGEDGGYGGYGGNSNCFYFPETGSPGTVRGGGGGGAGGNVQTWDGFHCADGGRGGNGGFGGNNGGTVIIYAKVLGNGGLIHANGEDGYSGSDGRIGEYIFYGIWPLNGDMAGGGGGGGEGGDGGNGGVVQVYYKTLQYYGTFTATGGNGGSGGRGGGSLNCYYVDLGSSYHAGASGYGGGGDGGDPEQSDGWSDPGEYGADGVPGGPGTVTVTQTILCYLDADDDGYGDVNDPGTDVIDISSVPDGFSVNNDDCNDNDATVNPGAAELCDGQDNDCDGSLITSELDVDGDGVVICAIDAGGWDGDAGVTGGEDNCPDNYNPDQEDTDGDMEGDACDSDDDNDGVADVSDTDPLDPYICQDIDVDDCDDCSIGVDGFGLLADNDPANDGIDTDEDGICDVSDWVCGDADASGEIDILDVVYIINFKYKEGPAPEPEESADADGILGITILDVVYLINFKYKEGPAPNCPSI